MRVDPTRQLWTSRYMTPSAAKNAQVDQEELLVARNKKQ